MIASVCRVRDYGISVHQAICSTMYIHIIASTAIIDQCWMINTEEFPSRIHSREKMTSPRVIDHCHDQIVKNQQGNFLEFDDCYYKRLRSISPQFSRDCRKEYPSNWVLFADICLNSKPLLYGYWYVSLFQLHENDIYRENESKSYCLSIKSISLHLFSTPFSASSIHLVYSNKFFILFAVLLNQLIFWFFFHQTHFIFQAEPLILHTNIRYSLDRHVSKFSFKFCYYCLF